ncbi:unnamed protein product, partial [Meganyctiphanes norvegica]
RSSHETVQHTGQTEIHLTTSKDDHERNDNVKGNDEHGGETDDEGFAGPHSSGAVAQKTSLHKCCRWRHRNKALGCTFAIVLVILVATCVVLSMDGNCLEDQTEHIASIISDDKCSYQTVCGNETEYRQFKNGTTISLKLDNVQEDLRIVTGITYHHPKFPTTSVSAQVEIVHGAAQGLVLKGTADSNLINAQETWKSEPMHIFPSLGNIFKLNFSVVENKLIVTFITRNNSKELTFNEDFWMSEDLKIRLGTYKSNVSYQVCFLES